MKLYLILSLIFLTSCASIIHGTTDQVTINSSEPNTVIYVDGVPRGRDIAVADLKRGQFHIITAKKEKCQEVTIQTTKKFDATSLLGVFIDLGIISIPMDFAIGGAQKTDPRSYTVTPICISHK